MKISKLVLILGLFLAGCSNKDILERKFSTNPLTATLGQHSRVFEDINLEINKSKKQIEESKYKTYDVVDGCRGDLLVKDLKEKLPENLNKSDLVFLFTGTTHMNSAYLGLKNDFNMYFFSEPNHLETKDDFLKDAPFLLAQYNRKSDKQNINTKKLDCIVYGDNHSKDFDFRKYFPSPNELKGQGYGRVIFAYEILGDGKRICLEDDENTKRFSNYLSDLKEAGIRVEVFGVQD